MHSHFVRLILRGFLLTILCVIYSGSISAFPTYDGCKDCHKSFTKSPYKSLRDDTSWGDDLMDRHTTFVGGACDACHKTGGKGNVFLNYSIDTALPKSCVGCHGRDEDVTGNCTGRGGGREEECGSSAGLRQHHELKVGVDTCNSCHTGDAVPVGEDINPFNYGRNRVVMQDACNLDGSESRVGISGLDNDGDGQWDQSDSDCQASTLTCMELGALAYDDWTHTEAGGKGVLPTGALESDYVRCKACHGWDHSGTDGGYHKRSREQGRANAGYGDTDKSNRNINLTSRNGADISAEMIWHQGSGRSFTDGAASWVSLDDNHSAANKAAHATGYTLGNQHPDFSGGDMTAEQVDCLVEFLNSEDADPGTYFSAIDTSQNPVQYTIVDSADALAGEAYYEANCSVCHGDPAKDHNGDNGGNPTGGVLAYLAGDGKFSEFAHKTRWGIPGSIMTRAAIGSPDSSNVANMMLYLQELGGTGFAINTGLSGDWFNQAERDGEGFLIDVGTNLVGDTVVIVAFYTYDSMANQAWILGAGVADGNSVVADLFFGEDNFWGDELVSGGTSNTPWGNITFSFSSCTEGHVALIPDLEMQGRGFTSLEYDVKRDLLLHDACPSPEE